MAEWTRMGPHGARRPRGLRARIVVERIRTHKSQKPPSAVTAKWSGRSDSSWQPLRPAVDGGQDRRNPDDGDRDHGPGDQALLEHVHPVLFLWR